MSHRTWITLASALLLSAPAVAQDLSGGFGSTLFSPLTTVAEDIYVFEAVAVADFDENGLADIATQDWRNQELVLLFGQQGAGLGSKVSLPTGVATLARVLAAEVDGDGHEDVLVVGMYGQMSWLRGHGDGTFDAPLPGGPPPHELADVLAADLDGDGRADLLVSQAVTQLMFRKGDGAGGFAAPVNLGLIKFPKNVLVRDLDDDGVLDIALLEQGQGQVRVLKGLGGGAFGPPKAWSTEAQIGLEAADLDLDGKLDLVHGGWWNALTVLPGLGGLQFGPPKFVPMAPQINGLKVADLDLDGVPDLLTSGYGDQSELTAQRMGLDGPIGPAFAHSLGTWNTYHMRIADFDGDGLIDVLAPGYSDFKLGQVLNGLGPFIGLGHVLAGPQGSPTLTFYGEPQAGSLLAVKVVGPPQPSAGMLFVGLQPANIPFAGGLFVPNADLSLGIPVSGGLFLQGTWPVGIPAGTTFYLQAWFTSGSGALSSSDAWLILSE